MHEMQMLVFVFNKLCFFCPSLTQEICCLSIIVALHVCVSQMATVYELDAVCLFGMEKKQRVTVTMKGIGESSHLFYLTLSFTTLVTY